MTKQNAMTKENVWIPLVDIIDKYGFDYSQRFQ